MPGSPPEPGGVRHRQVVLDKLPAILASRSDGSRCSCPGGEKKDDDPAFAMTRCRWFGLSSSDAAAMPSPLLTTSGDQPPKKRDSHPTEVLQRAQTPIALVGAPRGTAAAGAEHDASTVIWHDAASDPRSMRVGCLGWSSSERRASGGSISVATTSSPLYLHRSSSVAAPKIDAGVEHTEEGEHAQVRAPLK